VPALDRLASAGPSHPLVRRYARLRADRPPDRGSGVPLQGLWLTRAALDAGLRLEVLLVCPELLRGEESLRLVERSVASGTPTLRVGERLLRRMVDREGPDGLAAVAVRPTFTLADLAPTGTARVLVLDGPELPGNVGSLIRCADAVGACGVIVTNARVRLFHPVLVKASMGTVLSMPTVAASAEEGLSWLRGHRFGLVAADVGAGVSYREARYGSRVAVVLGSERSGLSPFWRQHAEQLVALPMLGRADSLNVGHAGAVLLYEALYAQEPSARSRPSRGAPPLGAPKRKDPDG
jgi:RNA methyltransferase, TrmH family